MAGDAAQGRSGLVPPTCHAHFALDAHSMLTLLAPPFLMYQIPNLDKHGPEWGLNITGAKVLAPRALRARPVPYVLCSFPFHFQIYTPARVLK